MTNTHRMPESVAAEAASNCFALTGELTIDQVTEVKPFLLAALAATRAEKTPLQLDISRLAECDGAGLQLLLALAMTALAMGSRIELLGAPDHIQELFGDFDVAKFFVLAPLEATR